MKILLTGARGFVGGAVARQLALADHDVTALAGDVRDTTAYPCRPFEAIVHSAALISHRGDHSEAELFDVNVGGTEKLHAAYPQAHFVYVSTTDVTREELTDYARSKLEAEKRVGAYPSHCIVRLTSVFGPGQRQQTKLIPRLVRHHVHGEAAPQISDDARPCVFVGEAAGAICECLVERGLRTVAGTVVHNRDLDRLIGAAARGIPESEIPLSERDLYRQFGACVAQARAAGPGLA